MCLDIYTQFISFIIGKGQDKPLTGAKVSHLDIWRWKVVWPNGKVVADDIAQLKICYK